MNNQINKSWREQRKAVLMKDIKTGNIMEYRSLWEAANQVARAMLCKHDTAKKEIRKAIRMGCQRYGALWSFKEEKHEQ